MTGRWLCLLLLWLALGHTSAFAQLNVQPLPEPSATPDKAAAHRLMGQAKTAFQKGDLPRTSELALEAYLAGGGSAALDLLGESLRRQGASADAYVVYARVAQDPRVTGSMRGRVDRTLAELARKSAALQIVTEPAGASVTLDGTPLGVSPIAGRHVALGPHQIRAGKAEFEPAKAEVMAEAAGAHAAHLVLQPVKHVGIVEVRESKGLPAIVVIDGAERGPAPWKGEVARGAHVIALRADAAQSPSAEISVVDGASVEVVLELIATTVHLRVTTEPPTAEIYVDGKVRAAGASAVDLPPGEHRVSAMAQGYESISQVVVLAPGTERTVHLALEPIAPATPPDVAEDPASPTGPFQRLGLKLLAELTGTVLPNCQTGCNSSPPAPLGGAFQVALGYQFDPVGLEMVVDFGATNLQTERGFEEPAKLDVKESFSYSRFHVIAALGPRFIKGSDTVQFVAGAAGGGIFRFLWTNLEISGSMDGTVIRGDSDIKQTYFAPAVLADAGVRFGSRGRTGLQLSLATQMDFPSDELVGPANTSFGLDQPKRKSYPRPAVPLAADAQVYIGLLFGLYSGS